MENVTDNTYTPLTVDPNTLNDRLRRLIEVAANATCEVFDVTMGTEVRWVETIMHSRPPAREGSLYGWMQLTGETPGVVVISIGSDLARDLLARLAGCGPDDLSEADVLDGLGEIVNQVAGRTATILTQQGVRVSIGLPSLEGDSGKRLDINEEHPCYALVFECLKRRMSVQVQLEN